jgi:uncharacterized phage protein gp47/JayE
MAELFVPDIETMRDDFLADLELGAIDAGIDNPPIEPGSDWYALATAEANLHAITCQNVRLADADTTPLTATDQRLEDWRVAIGTADVTPRGAAGRIVIETTGSASVVDGQYLTHANGNRYRVSGTWLNVQNNDEIDVVAEDTGEETDLDPGEVLRFVNTPRNVRKEATVSSTEPLTGGASVETDEQKRERVLNDLRTQPGGGNWGQLRQMALDASPAVQDGYVYPALGGPSSAKVVITKRFNPDALDFSRTPADSLLDLVRNKIHSEAPDMMAVVVQGSADQSISMSLQIEIPDSSLAGGDGTGWLDASPWPQLNGDTKVVVTTVTDSKTITVGALTTTAPVAGQTRIAWWCPTEQRFIVRRVITQSGSAGAWVLGLDQPLVSSDGQIVDTGEYISPVAANTEAYGKTWRDIMEGLGVGENTDDAYRLPRAGRHPLFDSQPIPALNSSQTRQLQNAHPEIQDVSYSYRQKTSPDVPNTVTEAPNVLVLDNFGIYKMV